MPTLLITLIILIAAILCFLSGRLRPDLVALLVAITLGITGILTSQEVFSGFSRSAVITIVAIFVLAEGLQRTGVTEKIGAFLGKLGGLQERGLMIVIMISGAFLSLFMNNIAAAAVLLPAVSGAARKSRLNPSRLLMPLAFGTILGGMATLFTTTNIVVSSVLRDNRLAGYGILDFAPLGLPLVALGIIFMATLGWHLLPVQSSAEHFSAAGVEEADLTSIYRLGERLILARIPPGSDLSGKTLEQSNLRQGYHLNLVAIESNTHRILSPSPEVTLKQGDILLLEGRPEEISQTLPRAMLELMPMDRAREQELESQRFSLVEAILAPRSALIGHTLRSTHFREKYDLNVLAIWRSGQPIRTNLSELTLQFGDTLLVQGARERLKLLHSEPDLIILNGGEQHARMSREKAWLALLIMAGSLLLAALNIVPVAESMLGGALLMILTGILSMDRAYQVIDWKSIFLIAGMLPMGIAMTKTGATAMLGEWMIRQLGPANPMLLLAGLVFITMLLSQVMNGAAVAAVVAPIAIGAAQQIGADPRAMAMGVAMAASMTFLTPLGHPVNVLVMGSGSYHFQDFFKVGLPLTILLISVMLALFPLIWPLTIH